MSIEEQIKSFEYLNPKDQMDNWNQLLELSKSVLMNDPRIDYCKKLSVIGFQIRQLMGSSKAYESATNIDLQLCKTSLELAKIGFNNDKSLIPFLDDAIYYSGYYPNEFDGDSLKKERASLSELY
jgi:hypothetical protein